MKLNHIALAGAIIAAGALVSSCDDDFARPPMIEPSGTETPANIGLTELKADYWSHVEGTPVTIGYWESAGEFTSTLNGKDTTVVYAPGDSIIFHGRICSSDESGNIYKNIIIQNIGSDPAEQCAITFAVNKTKLYENYKFGQEVVVYATGLSVGGYRGLMQFGTIGTSGMSFMDEAVFIEHVKTAPGLPDAKKVLVTPATIAELNAGKSDPEFVKKWQSRLIKLEGVHFAEGGTATFAGAQTTNRDLLDKDGNKIIVRTSAYADFAADRLPKGEGNVTAILSYFGSDWQLLLVNDKSCEGFENGGGDEPEPGPDPDAVGVISEGFKGEELPEGWSAIKVKGDKDWYVREFNGNSYANCSGYKGNPPFEAYLVTPAVNLDKSEAKVMSFTTQVNGYGSKTTTLKVFVCNSKDLADPKTVKTELKPVLAEAPESGYSSWVPSGELDLSAFSGVVYIAWQYAATADDNFATWCVDEVLIGKKGGDTPTPPTPNPGTETDLFSGLAETLTEMPEGWTFENIELGGLESVWSWKVYNGAGYLNASAYKGSAVASQAYCVSPEIDLTGATDVKASFDHAAKFQTTLRELCGFCVREAGAKDWTKLAIPTWPEAGAWKFANSGDIDLSAYNGKKIQLAFLYGSTAAGADTWEIKNLKVTGKK